MIEQITRNFDNSFSNVSALNRQTLLDINQILVENHRKVFPPEWMMTDQNVQARLFDKADSKHDYCVRWTFSDEDQQSLPDGVVQAIKEEAAEGIAAEMRSTIDLLEQDGLRPNFYVPVAYEVRVNPKTYDPEVVFFGLYDIVPV